MIPAVDTNQQQNVTCVDGGAPSGSCYLWTNGSDRRLGLIV